jgi:hypothetical protein
MITFSVVKEQHGWAVRMGAAMTTPFWSRALAIREANCLAESIRRHGQIAHVIIEGARLEETQESAEGSRSFRPNLLGQDRREEFQ